MDTSYDERNARFWSKVITLGRKYLFKTLALGDTNDEMKKHGVLRTCDERELALPSQGANFLKARGCSMKENRVTIS